jgi:integrase
MSEGKEAQNGQPEDPRHLSPAEEDRLMAVLSGRRAHLKPLITVTIYTGMRCGELLKLRRSHVDFGLNVINVKQTKTGKDSLDCVKD